MEQRMQTNADTAMLSIIHDLCRIPVFCWERGADLSAETGWGIGSVEEHPCKLDDDLRSMLESSMKKREAPVIFFENEFVYYGVMNWQQKFICLGPAVRVQVSSRFETHYSTSHGIKQTLCLERRDIGVVAKYLALLFVHYNGRPISYDEITIRGQDYSIDTWHQESALEHYQLAQSEYNRIHVRGIDFENELIDIVKRGDVDAVKKLMRGEIPDMEAVGTVANSQRKQAEYLTVSLLTLLTRAAIEGGVNSEKAYEIGDIFLKELESANDRGVAFAMIGFRAMHDFTEHVRLVKEQKTSQSYIIDACKDYVAKNLRKDLEVGNIAPAIGVSRTHLAHKFKDVEGITVQQYIQKERCRHAANLLRYSDYSIALISEYMGFSSQSYFGSCFKQWYGVTPKEYRQQNQRI